MVVAGRALLVTVVAIESQLRMTAYCPIVTGVPLAFVVALAANARLVVISLSHPCVKRCLSLFRVLAFCLNGLLLVSQLTGFAALLCLDALRPTPRY